MLNPGPFFAADYFATRDVTLGRLQKFTVDVITRLTQDNPGQVFDALIQDLTTLHTDLFGAQTTADAGLSQRSTAAQLMWGALADLQAQLEADEELLRYKAKKTPAVLSDLLPHGRSEYAKANLATAELLLHRAAAAAATHAKTLGADFDASRYAGFLQAFQAAREATGQGDEQAAKARAAASTHRQDLTQRLTDAVKLVAAHCLRDEARAAAYFRVALLQAPEAASSAPTPFPN
jgi:hypothetical protein